MKKLTKIAVLALGAALAAQGAHAAAKGDLILGINNNISGSPGNDFLFDLGQQASVPVNTPTSLGISSATLEADLGTGPVGYDIGVVAGHVFAANSGVNTFVYTSTLDSGSGTPTTPGSSAPNAPGSSVISTAGTDAQNLGLNATYGVVASSSTWSYTSVVAKNPSTPATFSSDLGSNPLQTFAGNSITLDLWADTITDSSGDTSGWTYKGDVKIDLSGTTATYTYDMVSAVPEPSTYGVFAAGGLLLLSLGNQLRRKMA